MGETMLLSDEFFMREALKEAKKAYQKGEVPVGAVIVCQQQVIARGHNLTELLHDVTAHAEMQAFTAAANFLGAKYLHDCTLYVTLEPCVMCMGAAYWTQISRIVYGADDEKRGFSILQQPIAHPKTVICKGVLAEECAQPVKDFFKTLRN